MGLALIAGVLYLVDGPGRFEANGVSFLQAVGLYFAAGAVAGPLFGVLLPFTVSRAGAVVVGAIVAVPAYLGAALLVGGSLGSGVVPAVLVGSIVGYVLWRPIVPEAESDRGDG